MLKENVVLMLQKIKNKQHLPPIKPMSPNDNLNHVRKIYSRSNNVSVTSHHTSKSWEKDQNKSSQRTNNSVKANGRLFNYTKMNKKMQQQKDIANNTKSRFNRTFVNSSKRSRGEFNHVSFLPNRTEVMLIYIHKICKESWKLLKITGLN